MAIVNIFEPGFRLINGSTLNGIFNGITKIVSLNLTGTLTTVNETVTGTQTVANNVQTAGGTNVVGAQVLTAAGSTQLGAAAITSSKAIVSVATTASTHGVRLPVATTGLEIEVGNYGAFGVKVYPATNGKIFTAATNAADSTVLAVGKLNRYVAAGNGTQWLVQRGA